MTNSCSQTPYTDEIAPMTDDQLFRVRGVDAVAWTEPLYKGTARAKAADGTSPDVLSAFVQQLARADDAP
jgi:hypothetical protein